MRLAVSNIAWPADQRQEAWEILRQAGISGVEVAPSMEWPDWSVTPGQASVYRQTLTRHGLTVSSLQAILFGQPDARLFGSVDEFNRLIAHLEYCAALAEGFGAGPLVFGAPKNRLRGELTETQAEQVALAAFRQVAPAFTGHGAILGLEANPTVYGCDFMTCTSEAAHLVRAVDRPAIGLHLDTACTHLGGESPADLIHQNFDILRHVHVSEPFLGPFETPGVELHESTALALHQTGYAGWVVLEMRATATPLASLRQAARFLVETYGEPRG